VLRRLRQLLLQGTNRLPGSVQVTLENPVLTVRSLIRPRVVLVDYLFMKVVQTRIELLNCLFENFVFLSQIVELFFESIGCIANFMATSNLHKVIPYRTRKFGKCFDNVSFYLRL
jgi:hypothetical protein